VILGMNYNPEHIPDNLYSQIKLVMPIVCVDLVVINRKEEVLLLKRRNHPAKGQWWFPGGRVYLNEKRIDAARRILWEECALVAETFDELFTGDCILRYPKGNSHAVTTFYKALIMDANIILDYQSVNCSWKSVSTWKAIIEGQEIWPFISKIFTLA
jgi:colanic acid biosynthesis protein WcaH